LNATGPECCERCKKVGKKNFAVWYDPGNIAFYSDGKLNPVEDAASVDGLVCACQSRTSPSRSEWT